MREKPPVPCGCNGCRGCMNGLVLPVDGGGEKAVALNEVPEIDLAPNRDGAVGFRCLGDEGTECIRGCRVVIGDMVGGL